VRRQQEENPALSGIEHLAQLYGSNLTAMLAEANNRPELREPLGTTGDIGAQVLYAIREEMAISLDDVLLRRTGIGQLGRPPTDVIEKVASLMAVELGWNEEQRKRELANVAPRFLLQAAA